jgi:hypothetical protein
MTPMSLYLNLALSRTDTKKSLKEMECERGEAFAKKEKEGSFQAYERRSFSQGKRKNKFLKERERRIFLRGQIRK